MKKRAVLSVLLLALFAVSAGASEIRGSWTADAADIESGKIHLQLSRRHNNTGLTMELAALAGLSDRQVRAATQTSVQFALRREAGTVDFEGTFKAGFGAGQFTFTANPSYLDTLRSIGVSLEPSKQRTRETAVEERLLHLALHDVSTAFIRSMQAEGYDVSLEQYTSFRIFRVTPELVRELRRLGYDKVSAGDLVSTRIHKVTPQFIQDMSAAGYRSLPLKDLVSARIHKVTPEFISELAALGYRDIPFRKLVSMRIHRVTPDFIRDLRSAGYADVPVDKLISMRIHGVDGDFARRMNSM